MATRTIDLNYIKFARNSILNRVEGESNINTQPIAYSLDLSLIMNLHIEIANLANRLKISNYPKELLLSDLIKVLKIINDIANFLEIDLISEIEVEEDIKREPLEIINSLFNTISMLNYRKASARSRVKNRIIPLFAELVETLGLTLEELEDYFKKMQQN